MFAGLLKAHDLTGVTPTRNAKNKIKNKRELKKGTRTY